MVAILNFRIFCKNCKYRNAYILKIVLDRTDYADFGCHNSIRLEAEHFLNTSALTFISFSGRFVFAVQKHLFYFFFASDPLVSVVFFYVQILLWVLCFPYPCTDWSSLAFLCFLGLKIFLRYLCIPNPCTDFRLLVFWQHLATSVAMATLFSQTVSLTYISVDFLYSKPLHE